MATHVSKAKKTKATPTKDKTASKQTTRSRKKVAIIIAWVFVALFLFDLTIGGTMKFYAKWIECGTRPIGVTGKYFAGRSYYHATPTVNISPGSVRTYFCTALEAEQAGFSANQHQYDTPELDKLRSTQD